MVCKTPQLDRRPRPHPPPCSPPVAPPRTIAIHTRHTVPRPYDRYLFYSGAQCARLSAFSASPSPGRLSAFSSSSSPGRLSAPGALERPWAYGTRASAPGTALGLMEQSLRLYLELASALLELPKGLPGTCVSASGPPGAYSPAISAARSLRALHSARVIALLRAIWGSSLGTKSNTCPRSQ